MRINRFLASSGLGSRRKMDLLVQSGKVKINNIVIKELGTIVNPAKDVVEVDGRVVSICKDKVVYILNKPAGYLTSMHDPHGRKTVKDLIKDIPMRIFPVGRLDMDTEGLLVFTNDGKLSHRLSHPKYGVEKEYKVKVKGILTDKKVYTLENGVELEEGLTSRAKVLNFIKQGNKSSFNIILHEGWKRQVRRMCDAVGLPVIKLKRVRYAFLNLEGIKSGEFKKLSLSDIQMLKKMTGL